MLPACVTQAQQAGKETMLGVNLLRIKQFGKQVIMRALQEVCHWCCYCCFLNGDIFEPRRDLTEKMV